MKERIGKRKERKYNIRQEKLGYYVIVTDTAETEKNYFEGLKKSFSNAIQNTIEIKIIHNVPTNRLIDTCIEIRDKQLHYSKIWIVFDRDKVKTFNTIIETANKVGVYPAWSNPCFEIWLWGYFAKPHSIEESTMCCEMFKHIFKNKTGKDYKKSMADIYNVVITYGNEEQAIKIAKERLKTSSTTNIPYDKTFGTTTVFQLVEELKKYKR